MSRYHIVFHRDLQLDMGVLNARGEPPLLDLTNQLVRELKSVGMFDIFPRFVIGLPVVKSQHPVAEYHIPAIIDCDLSEFKLVETLQRDAYDPIDGVAGSFDIVTEDEVVADLPEMQSLLGARLVDAIEEAACHYLTRYGNLIGDDRDSSGLYQLTELARHTEGLLDDRRQEGLRRRLIDILDRHNVRI